MTTKKELNRIRKWYKCLDDVEWIESSIIGFMMKTQVITRTKIKMGEELGYSFRHAKPYTLDQNFIIANFEVKENHKCQ